jgi:hypothetical protein
MRPASANSAAITVMTNAAATPTLDALGHFGSATTATT